ncbi:hypothetical protein F7725_019361 [Dissostichus mawsoni]|uniref:Uncharacterized protein n=1 Tax=Dissostichus mawsoni TaxID=36200 RepID=A0A7J5YJG9_DISMA|nr:hypothetical protein F7725_019361 [Dissostichus mawsoni]
MQHNRPARDPEQGGMSQLRQGASGSLNAPRHLVSAPSILCACVGYGDHSGNGGCQRRNIPRNTWTTTITVPKGVDAKYRYLKGFFLESKLISRKGDNRFY